MLKPSFDHTKLLTSKIKPKGRLIGGSLDNVQKHKNKRERIFYKTMLMVVTTQTSMPQKYTLKMNYKFYKTKQIDIKINAHNKTNGTYKKTTRHTSMQDTIACTMFVWLQSQN